MARKESKFNIGDLGLFEGKTTEEIREAVLKKQGRPQNENLIREPGAQKGLPAELTRQTLIVSVDQIETLKNYAYTERLKLRNVVAEAFEEYIEKHIDRDKLLIRPKDWR